MGGRYREASLRVRQPGPEARRWDSGRSSDGFSAVVATARTEDHAALVGTRIEGSTDARRLQLGDQALHEARFIRGTAAGTVVGDGAVKGREGIQLGDLYERCITLLISSWPGPVISILTV